MKVSKVINDCVVEIVKGDITLEETEAIVNAANKALSPGGGVAGAIHRKAGPQLWEECKKLGGCETGEAKITKGYNLPAKYVIHTVGPVYSNSPSDPILLRNCYTSSLTLALEHKIKSIAFPAISTGAFGYPMREASMIAITTVVNFLKKHKGIELVRFVLFDDNAFNIYKEVFEDVVK